MAYVDSVSVPRRKHMKKMSSGDLLFAICAWTFLILFCLITLYPFFRMIALSFSGSIDAYTSDGPYLIPRHPTLENYVQVLFKRESIRNGAITTVARTAIGTITALSANAFLAYILSRRKFLFRSQLSLFWVFTLYVSGGIVPIAILMKHLHLLGSFWVYILPGLVSAYHVMVMKAYMEKIPDSLEESAQLDGAGHLKIFFHIVSPLCKPLYAAIALFIATYHWHAWFDAMLFNRLDVKNTTLQYELMKYSTQTVAIATERIHGGSLDQNMPTPSTMSAALAIVSMVPILLLYPFLQKYFETGLKIRGLKK